VQTQTHHKADEPRRFRRTERQNRRPEWRPEASRLSRDELKAVVEQMIG
jgi:hypothetical protein